MNKSTWRFGLAAAAVAAVVVIGIVLLTGNDTGAQLTPSSSPTQTPQLAAPAQLYPGTLLITRISEADDNYDIYVVRGDGTGLKQLTAGRGNEEHAYWSPDGTRIVFGRTPSVHDPDAWQQGRVSIWVMNADGSGKVYLGEGKSPSWSPDGKQILYQPANRNGFGIMNADGSGRRVVGVPDPPSYATWAPNGKIVFVSAHLGSGDILRVDLYAVNPDGSGLQRLTKGADMILPSVSPDGSTIAAYATKTDRLIAVPYGGDGPAVTLLADASEYFLNGGRPLAHWAPDGKTLVLGSSNYGEVGGAGLYIVNADGSGLAMLPVTQAIGPDWQPE